MLAGTRVNQNVKPAGMTETCTAVTFPPVDRKLGTLGSGGVLLPGCVARVVKPDGSLAPQGETGELVIKSPSLAIGYLNNEQAYVQHVARVALSILTALT